MRSRFSPTIEETNSRSTLPSVASRVRTGCLPHCNPLQLSPYLSWKSDRPLILRTWNQHKYVHLLGQSWQTFIQLFRVSSQSWVRSVCCRFCTACQHSPQRSMLAVELLPHLPQHCTPPVELLPHVYPSTVLAAEPPLPPSSQKHSALALHACC